MADISRLTPSEQSEVKKAAPSVSWMPGRKVLAAGIAGVITFAALTALKVWGHVDVQAYLDLIAPPPGTYSAQALITGAVTLGVSYITPPSIKDVIGHLNDRIVALAGKVPDVPVTPLVSDPTKDAAQ